MPPSSTRNAAVIGAGPAGLFAAETLARAGVHVTVYERMASPARKLLLAGRGGLNLTHSEPLATFLTRYGARAPDLGPVIERLPPDALRAWAHSLGQETFVGTSGRVFPRSMKTSPLLRAWLRELERLGVVLKVRHRWSGWGNDGALLFETPEGPVEATPDCTILALGGASWPHLGSDGSWVEPVTTAGLKVSPLRPANSGFLVSWSEIFSTRFAGQPLKRVALSFARETVRGEAMITAGGIEGGAVYALGPQLREAVLAQRHATMHIDLRPDSSIEEIERRLSEPRKKQTLANFLRKQLSLTPAAIGLLQEAAHATATPIASLDAGALGRLVKAVPVTLCGIAPIARAISTAGGLALEEIDEHFMLRARPGTFAAGEMLDWEAPTGGYLLQASFATGHAAAEGALSWLAERG